MTAVGRIALAYRLIALVLGVVSILIADQSADALPRLAVPAVLVTAGLVSFLQLRGLLRGQLLILVLVIDVLAAGACVAWTGGESSTFVLYLVASPLAAALMAGPAPAAAIGLMAVGVYLAAVRFATGGSGMPSLEDIGFLVAVPAVSGTIIHFAHFGAAWPAGGYLAMPHDRLEAEDRLILERLQQGMTYRQIGIETMQSASTVKVKVQRLYRRLGVATREQAVDVANRSRLNG